MLTALVGLAVFLPFATLAVDALRDVREIVDYSRTVEESGIPVPDFVIQSPYVGQWVGDWWRENLSHAGWAKEIAQQVNTSSIRELGANLGANAVHRVVLFGISLLTLFFLFRHGESISMQCRTASQKLFGERGERVALQMVASVHGTVAGLILVAIGEGILLGIVYFLTKLPHPILFEVATAVAAMIPFAAVLAVGLAALVLLGSGGVGPALIVVLAGFAVIFVARPLREAKADRRRYKASVFMGFAWHPRRRRELPASRPFSGTSDNGRVDAALAPVDNVPRRPTRRARHIRADRPLTKDLSRASRGSSQHTLTSRFRGEAHVHSWR
jgi:AI-2E family transporter